MKALRTMTMIALIGAATGITLTVASAGSSAPKSRAAIWVDSTPVVQTEPDVRAYMIGGNIRPNHPNASAGWHIIDDANHDAPGLTGVTCLSSGYLRVSYPTTARVGVLQANADEEWSGRFHAGGSQGFSATDFKLTNAVGTQVPCNSPLFTSAGNWTVQGFMLYPLTH